VVKFHFLGSCLQSIKATFSAPKHTTGRTDLRYQDLENATIDTFPALP